MHVDEKIEMVTYLGRSVPRENFRTYIYSTDGRQKLVESFDEFDLFTHSNEWFATKEEALDFKKPAKKKSTKVEIVKNISASNEVEEEVLLITTGE